MSIRWYYRIIPKIGECLISAGLSKRNLKTSLSNNEKIKGKALEV